MGAKESTIVYRRNKEQMPARDDELNAALKDGVKIIYNTKVLEAEVKRGKINKIKCIKTKNVGNGIKDIEDSTFYMKADSIIFAIGFKTNKELLENEGIKTNENGFIKVDENFETSIKGVFAGGDAVQKEATVCMAVRNGKDAAKSINNFLKNS